jgi:hypothetical protein
MEQKFTDQQMALILKRAAERQAEGGEPVHSLESIQEIARQVGIDPRLVADAAATLETSRDSSLFGAPSAFRSSRRLPLRSIDHAAVLATIRDHLTYAGEARHVGDGIEWHSGPADNKTVIAVAPGAEGTTLRIDARQHGPKAMLYIGAATVGVVAGVVGAALLSGIGVGVGLAALATSFAGARAIWNHQAHRRDKRLRDLSDALAGQLEASADASDQQP